jgi:hypothetical protein
MQFEIQCLKKMLCRRICNASVANFLLARCFLMVDKVGISGLYTADWTLSGQATTPGRLWDCPLYNPDPTPSDFHLSGSLKQNLAGK